MVKELFDLKLRKVGRYDEFELIPYLVKQEGFKWFIYGAGEFGKLLYDVMKKLYGLEPDFFVDKQPELIKGGYDICSVEELMKMDLKKCIGIISPCKYLSNDNIRWEIDDVMHKLNEKCDKFMCLHGRHLIDAFKSDWYDFIKNNVEEFDKTYELLEDDLSKKTYLDFLKIYVLGERYSGITMPEEYKYWGIDTDRRFIQLLDNEVLLNVGACWGDTVYQFLKLNTRFKKIIAVEGIDEFFVRLKRNISLLDDDIQKKIVLDNYFLDGEKCSIDQLYADENITLINMDIEGAELSVLHSAEQTIKKSRPVLSICAYHKKDDLIEIPRYIRGIVDDYVYIVRKYPSEYLANKGSFYIDYTQENNELVLYAIPKERYLG